MRRMLVVLLMVAILGLAAFAWRAADAPVPALGRHEAAVPDVAMPEVALRSRGLGIDIEPPPADEHAFDVAPAVQAEPAADALFDETVPLSERIAELDRRARRGDAAAGCQLGIEMVRCARERNMQGYHENLDAQARGVAQRTTDARQLRSSADFMLQRQERNRRVLASCAAVEPAQWAAPARYLRLAAERGHRPAMRLMLQEDLYRAEQLYRDPGLIPMLRADGPRWFRSLVESGDPAALQRARNASDRDFLPEILPPPWNTPDMANEILRQMHGSSPLYPPPAQPFPAEQMAEASRMRQDWFEPNRERHEREAAAHDNALTQGDAADFGCRELVR